MPRGRRDDRDARRAHHSGRASDHRPIYSICIGALRVRDQGFSTGLSVHASLLFIQKRGTEYLHACLKFCTPSETRLVVRGL